METGRCMICHDDADDLISPHQSGGTVHLVHHECMMSWIRSSHSLSCPFCFERLNPLVYRDTGNIGGTLLKAVDQNNCELIAELDVAEASTKNLLQALQMAAENYYLGAFDLILEKMTALPAPIEMSGFFEFLCGKRVSLLSVQKLHEFICSTRVTSIDYDAALAQASNIHNTKVFYFLLEKGQQDLQQLWQCMSNALMVGNLNIVRILVERRLFNGDVIRETVLQACSSGRLSVLQLLVENGGWIPLDDSSENSRLYLERASEFGHLEVVKFLFQAVDCSAMTLNCFPEVCENGHTQIVKLLLDRLQNINLQEGGNTKSLGLAAGGGHLELVRLLHERGAAVAADRNLGLRLASKNGHLHIVRYLVENGADIHAGDDYAVCWASKHGHLKIVRYLVGQGANYKAQEGFALREAQKNDYNDVVNYLLALDIK